MILEPVEVTHRALFCAIVDILLEESEEFLKKLRVGVSAPEEKDRLEQEAKSLVAEAMHTGIEYALWKFGAAIDKSRSLPESPRFIEALKRVAQDG